MMDRFAEKIWEYGILSDREKEDIDTYVQKHPEYEELLIESKALYSIIEGAGLLAIDPPGEVALAYYVANSQMRSRLLPPVLNKSFKQLQSRIEAMPQHKERLIEIQNRMEGIVQNSDPASQFEQLTGYNLDKDFEGVEKQLGYSGRRIQEDRSRVPRGYARKWQAIFRHPSVYILALLILLGGIMHTNRVSKYAYTHGDVLLADMLVDERGLDSYEKPVSPDIVFTFAQRSLYKAQKTWFGVYYSFDSDELEWAEELFNRVLDDEQASSFMVEESRYLLSKIYIAQKEYAQADSLLGVVVDMKSRRSKEAERLQRMIQ